MYYTHQRPTEEMASQLEQRMTVMERFKGRRGGGEMEMSGKISIYIQWGRLNIDSGGLKKDAGKQLTDTFLQGGSRQTVQV
ncbi:hypothetical protein EYF80_022973 [Liparis tanakae]|uniref:Uncharacterized protein n=1 Tax=Liparis tanakae TaxID=230148 RepID=A0A4Z2HMG3_9TELE|nr:hypothetical protein EYF80_022973 [Liparis tanakae]